MSELSILVILGVVTALIVVYAIRLRAVPMPSGRKARNEIISYLPKEPCRVTDFGSGWGDLAINIARARPDITVTGIELSPLPYAVSRIRGAGNSGRENGSRSEGRNHVGSAKHLINSGRVVNSESESLLFYKAMRNRTQAAENQGFAICATLRSRCNT